MTEVQITCLCGKVCTLLQLQQPIPVESLLCHQSQCRYNLGALCHSSIPFMDRPEQSVLDHLTSFEPRPGFCRYFCKTCGCHMFEEDHGWRVQSGVIERIHSEQVSNPLERIAGHQYVHETIDGGLSRAIPGADASSSEYLSQTIRACSRIESIKFPSLTTANATGSDDQTLLRASCMCGGVQFCVTRPNATSSLCSSPWPDLIVPHCDPDSNENPEDVKWWITGGDKWMAGTCACRSCRLGLGGRIMAWAFVSKTNLFKPDGSDFSYDLGRLKSFESSPGNTREFCSNCGATAFWHNTERPGVVDVSVGLLRAQEGALANSWLHWWTQRVSFAEVAVDDPVVAMLESRLQHLAS